ncbi:MAG: hypothetical protein ACLP1Y_15925 [Candidatus Acidiferrales bacterium]
MIDNPDKAPTSTPSAEDTPKEHHEETTPPAPPPTPPASVPSPPNQEGGSSQEKRDRLERWKFGVEVATVIIIAIYTGIAAWQLREMRKATVAATKSADTAKDTLVRSQRPWLGNDGDETLAISEVSDGMLAGKFTFSVKNYGSSPALSVGQAIYPCVRIHGDMSDFEAAKKEACGQADTVAFITGNSIFPQQSYGYGTKGAFVVPGLRKEIGRIVIEGCLAYTDQFDPAHTIHHTSFCIVGDAQSRDIQNSRTLGLCGYHEIAD